MDAHAYRSTRVCRVLIGLAVLWGIVGLPGGGSWAYDIEQTRATLRGLGGVGVVVESLKPEVERAGLTRQQLQTDVELQLRQAGIRVLTDEEQRSVQGQPWLYILVHVFFLSPGSLAAFRIDVELNQRVYLETDASLAVVATWKDGGTGSGDSARLATIRNYVRDYVDRFINAYLSVHPRPASSTAPSSTSPRRDLIRQVQERLQAVGFNPGFLDGTMGPQTQQALRWFQNAQGLRATGDLDEHTLNALGIR